MDRLRTPRAVAAVVAALPTVALSLALSAGCNAGRIGTDAPGTDVRGGPTDSPSILPDGGTVPFDGGGSRDDARAVDTRGRDRTAGLPDGEDEPPPTPGLRAEYFHRYVERVLERVEPALDHDWADGAPAPELGADRFSARWTGWLVPPASGSYRIVTDTDDGVRVWVGTDAPIIDDWRGHFVTRNEAAVELEAGVAVPLRVDYFEIDLAASARLSWVRPDGVEEVIPTDALRAATGPSDLPSPRPTAYGNPVVPFDCPDPGVIATGAGEGSEPPLYVAVCTGGRFRVRTSRSLVLWDDTESFVLPDGKPAWAANGNRNWAPEIHRVGDRYIAYYTSVNGSNILSIGAAHAPSPLGPYTDLGRPLVEHPQGVIDAHFFEDDDGSRWLLYKIDGNAHRQPTPIFIRQLAADGLSFAPGSQQVQILTNDPGTWEGGVVEAPWLIKRDGVYYLFYSGNVYDHRYRTGVARATSLTGPYEKHGAPILANNERWVGPGHGSVVRVGEQDYFVYHAWANAGNGTNAPGGRNILLDRIVWENGWPRIHDGTPSRSSQPWPEP